MGENTLNDKRILKARIYEPRTGPWHADLEVDSEVDITGAVTLSAFGGITEYTGTVFRGGVDADRWMGRVVGGAGGLGNDVSSKFYDDISFGEVIEDLMTESGETLSSDTASAITGHQRAKWQRTAGKISYALHEIVEILNRDVSNPQYIWRVQRDGTVLIASDSFPVLSFAQHELDRKQSLGEVVIAPLNAAELRPGVTFNGAPIDYVLTEINSESVRQRYWIKDA